jgi:D-alanyl-D-alanine carboxypeptidase
MTAVCALENIDAGTVVTVPREAVGIEGSSIYLREGEKITVENLLYALMLQSANDAAKQKAQKRLADAKAKARKSIDKQLAR